MERGPLVLWLLAAFLTAACADAAPYVDGDDGDDAGLAPERSAAIVFTPELGETWDSHFDPAVGPWLEADAPRARGELVVMVCVVTDPECVSPVLVTTVSRRDPTMWEARSTGPVPIGRSSGPEVRVDGLPAGEHLIMVIYDSYASRLRGYGHQDEFPSRERAWGGLVSETDMMLSAESTTGPSSPAPMRVSLSAGATHHLGRLALSHFYERDLSAPLKAENGVLVAASRTHNSLRLIDLNTHDLSPWADGDLDLRATDGDGRPLDAKLCGLVDGRGARVHALFDAGAPEIAGYLVAVDLDERRQVGPPTVLVADDHGRLACRARDVEGSHSMVVLGGTETAPEPGIWIVTSEAGAEPVVEELTTDDDSLFEYTIRQATNLGPRVFVSLSPETPICAGSICVAELVDGRLVREPGGDLRLWPNAATDEIAHDRECDAPIGLASTTLGGRDYLVLGTCSRAWFVDIQTGELLEPQPSSDVPGLDLSHFGTGFPRFVHAPNREILWALPSQPSTHDYQVEAHWPDLVGEGPLVSLARQAAAPIDVSGLAVGARPQIVSRFANDDRDVSHPSAPIGAGRSPILDPGIDLRALFLRAYLLFWHAGLEGAMPTFAVSSPRFAVTRESIWFAPVGESDGSIGDLGVLDLTSQRLVLWPGDGEFFGPFSDLRRSPPGFDLAPERLDPAEIVGLIFHPG